MAPLSSPGSYQQGPELVLGLEWAVEDVNAAGGVLGKQVELIVEDTQGRPPTGATVVEKLITKDKVVAAAGEYHSSVCKAEIEVFHQHGIPFVIGSCWSDSLTAAGYDEIFRTSVYSSKLAENMVAVMAANGIKKAASLVEDTDYGIGIAKNIENAIKKLNVDIDFQYEVANHRALHGVRIEVPAGKTVALVGSSGAGKTTIAHLLMRFWDPENGVIRLGGHDLRDYALDDLRRKLALVAQDTYLFNDTLRANILIANPEADEAALMLALHRASLGDFVAGLPDGLETKVGERGMRLSGGQRQRVAIARAFLKDAPVLILDEATSHLDAVNEQAVRKALEELMADRTTIVIAHRLSTVRNADMIVALNEGRVMESGTHDELLAKRGLYAQLVLHQLTGGASRTAVV